MVMFFIQSAQLSPIGAVQLKRMENYLTIATLMALVLYFDCLLHSYKRNEKNHGLNRWNEMGTNNVNSILW